MSSLVFTITETGIVLGMDTLAVWNDGTGKPHHFTTKFYAIPHLDGVVCGTGDGDFIAKWFLEVNCDTVANDFADVDNFAPKRIRALAESVGKDVMSFLRVPFTIYHFGFSKKGTRLAFAYRSSENFKSEKLADGAYTKPEGIYYSDAGSPDFQKIMLSQRAKQDSYTPEEKVYIGGEIIVCHLAKGAMSIERHWRFPDAEQDFSKMTQDDLGIPI